MEVDIYSDMPTHASHCSRHLARVMVGQAISQSESKYDIVGESNFTS